MTKQQDDGKKTLIAEIGTSEDEFKKIEVPVEEERIEALPEEKRGQGFTLELKNASHSASSLSSIPGRKIRSISM